jgi:hypothetical protein
MCFSVFSSSSEPGRPGRPSAGSWRWARETDNRGSSEVHREWVALRSVHRPGPLTAARLSSVLRSQMDTPRLCAELAQCFRLRHAIWPIATDVRGRAHGLIPFQQSSCLRKYMGVDCRSSTCSPPFDFYSTTDQRRGLIYIVCVIQSRSICVSFSHDRSVLRRRWGRIEKGVPYV